MTTSQGGITIRPNFRGERSKVRILGYPAWRPNLSERFPTEVRAAAGAFCYHQGAIFGGLVAPVLTYFAINYQLGFGISTLVGTVVGAVSFVPALLLGPETKGKELVPDLMVAPPGRPALSTVDGG